MQWSSRARKREWVRAVRKAGLQEKLALGMREQVRHGRMMQGQANRLGRLLEGQDQLDATEPA